MLKSTPRSMRPFLRTTKRAILKYSFFAIPAIFLALSGCKESDEQIGLNLRPDGGVIEGIVVDSFNIITRTIAEDSLQTDSLSRNVLGSMNDPVFGKSSASLAFDFSLPEINIDFGADPKLDSVILTIVYEKEIGHYGDFTSPQQLEVYRLDEQLERELSYSSEYIPRYTENLATVSRLFQFDDTVSWDEEGREVTEVGVLRIPLNAAFGNELLQAEAGVYGSNDAFRDFLNGMYIKAVGDPMSGEGGIANVNLLHNNSKLLLYYNDTLTEEFLITSTSSRFGHYDVDIPGSIESQFGQVGVHFDETYVQSMGASKTRINIEGLYDLVADGEPIFINEAKITLSVKDGSTSDERPAPERLLLLQPAASDSSNAFILDLIDVVAPPNANWIGRTNYGGNLDPEKNTYTFHVNRHLQDLLDTYLATGEKKDRGFYLIIPSDNPITASRLILDNSQNGAEPKIEFKVTYIKL